MHEQQQGDCWPGVTTSVLGQPCDSQLHVTAATEITTSHVFTLIFRGGAIAVLHIHGAPNQDEARAHASSILPHSIYEVMGGDATHGRVAPFHAWTDAAAQEALSLREARERIQTIQRQAMHGGCNQERVQ